MKILDVRVDKEKGWKLVFPANRYRPTYFIAYQLLKLQQIFTSSSKPQHNVSYIIGKTTCDKDTENMCIPLLYKILYYIRLGGFAFQCKYS